MIRELKGTQRLHRFLGLRVQGTGTAAILEGQTDATLVDNGVGDYTILFKVPYRRLPIVNVMVVGTTTLIARIHAITAAQVQIKLFAVDGTTATDGNFHLSVDGWDATDRN